MTKLRLEQSKLLKNLIDPLVNISEDIFIEITDKGLHAQARDPGSVWLGDVFLPKHVFTSIEAGDNALYSVRIKDLADFLKTAQSDEALTLSENTEEGSLEIELKSTSMKKKMLLRLSEIPDNFRFFDILQKEFDVNSEMQSGLFSQAIKATELGGDQINIVHTKESIFFSANSTTRSAEADVSFESENARVVDFKGEKHEGIYKLDFLKIASKVGKSDDKVKISMTENQPIRIVYSLEEDEDEESKSYIAFAIAPRVKDEQ